jgi:hypothetical protein
MADWDVVSQTPVGDDASGWEVDSVAPVRKKSASMRAYVDDAKKLVADPLGVAWEDVKAIPEDIVKGVGALADRGAGYFTQPRTALADAIRVLRKTNPVTLLQDTATSILDDPEGSARMVADPARPVSTALNYLTMGTGGGVTAGRAALKGATTVGKGADFVGGLPVSLLSGQSHDVQRLAFEAGKRGGSAATALKKRMRGGGVGAEDVVDKAVDALAAKQAANSADYLAGRTTWGDPAIILDGGAVKQSLRDARREFSFEGVPDNNAIVTALNEAENIIRRRLDRPVPANTPEPSTFRQSPPQTVLLNPQPNNLPIIVGPSAGPPSVPNRAMFPQQRTLSAANANVPQPDAPHGPYPSPHYNPLGFDKMKQELDTLMYDRNLAPQGTKARAAVGKVAGTVRDQLYKYAPSYAEEMEIAAKNAREIKEIRKTLSLGEKSSVDSALAKLQSTLRNDVASRFGFRQKSLMDKLAKYEPDLPYELAGMSLGSWMPRGITGRVAQAGTLLGTGAAGTGAMTGLVNPAVLALLPLSIPRLVGEARYAAGSAVRGARKVGATQKNLGKVAEAGRINSLFYPEEEEDE